MKRLNIIFFLVACIIVAPLCAADEAEPTVDLEVQDAAARQLSIMKTALLMGPDEQNRLNAALELLLHSQPEARQVLLDALKLNDNSPARIAVCRALVTSRTAITEKDDFKIPLLDIIRTSSDLDAKRAAEATLIFDYSEIAEYLNEITTAEPPNRQQNLNAIYALSLRPVDKEAVSTIVSLLSAEDKLVSQAAKQALPYWIPPEMDANAILKYLKRTSQSVIVKDWIDFQEKELRRLKQETMRWQKLYLAELDKEYEAAENAKKGALLLARLQSDQDVVKIWALEKFEKFPAAATLSQNFTSTLLALISDPNRQVRLLTAQILAEMSDTNPAQKLLDQLKIEQYPDVRLAIFEALGEACYFAFSPGSSIELSNEMRTDTLAWAKKFIDQDDLPPAKAAVEVIRKLLEPNGLEEELIDEYLNLVAERYKRANEEENIALRTELLHIMARLCAQGIHRDKAAALFRESFIEGLTDIKNVSVRLAAVAGLINIDKTTALKIFKEHNLSAAESTSVRSAMIALAGQVGNVEDIEWLSPLIVGNGEGEIAWQAVRGILQRQSVKTVVEAITKLEGTISEERIRNLLEMAVKKAEAENDPPTLREVSEKLRLMNLQFFLRTSDYEKAVALIELYLEQADLGDDNIIIKSIQKHLTLPDVNIEQKTLLIEKLAEIKMDQTSPRPQWNAQMKLLQQIIEQKPKPAPVPQPLQAPKKVSPLATRALPVPPLSTMPSTEN